jgi:hypothetical protein
MNFTSPYISNKRLSLSNQTPIMYDTIIYLEDEEAIKSDTEEDEAIKSDAE